VRTLLVSLCGSDVHMLNHMPDEWYPGPVGTTGHEVVGLVEDVAGPGENSLKPGTRALVIVPYHQGMTELYLAPLEYVLPLPPGKPLEHLLMGQQLGTVIYSCRRLPNVVGKEVVVIGQGSAGLFWDFMLRRLGARTVIGLDRQAARTAAGLRFGATYTVQNDRGQALQAVSDLTHGGLADVVIEAAGDVDAINLAAHLMKPGGHIHFFGIPRGSVIEFDFRTFFSKYGNTSSQSGTAFEPGHTSTRLALDMIAQGVVDVSPMLTHRFPFSRVMDGYTLARTLDDGVIKTVIEMPGFGKQ
jgi:threonine dehydrogenase-like Zn-dependent dehydrogenase